MQIVSKKISELVFDPNNARKHDGDNLKAIKGSLTKFGQQKPIVIDEKNVVVAGNGTLEAATQLGWDEINCVVTELHNFDKAAFALADNRSSELAEWDKEILSKTLSELNKNGLDILELGFDLNEISKNIENDEKDDEIPEVDGNKFNVLRGQVWKLGNHRLMCGDSTDITNVNKLLGQEKADVVFTDPPYGINCVNDLGHIGGGEGVTKFRKVIGDDKEFDASFLIDLAPVCFIWGGNFFAHTLPKSGRWFVWDKMRSEGLSLSGCELAWSNIKGVKVQKFECLWDGFRRVEKENKRIHPNQKPIKLLEDVFQEVPFNLCLDLFLGSGSTLIACEKTGRKCYGMEIDEEYCSVIIERWQNLTGQIAMLC